MNSPSSPAQPPALRPEKYALRFGINDLLCIPALFGLHMGVGLFLLDNPHDTERVIACAVMSATLTFATAYLTYRLTTTKRIEDFGARLMWLMLIELLLVFFLPFGGIMVGAVAVSCPWLLVIALTFYIGYRIGQSNPPAKKHDVPKVIQAEFRPSATWSDSSWIVNGTTSTTNSRETRIFDENRSDP
jgi:hypothetical protein